MRSHLTTSSLKFSLRKKTPFIVGLLLLLLFTPALFADEARNYPLPSPQKGVLDLREWDFERDGGVDLDLEWEFYWKKLLSPTDFKTGNETKNIEYLSPNVPWGQSQKSKGRYGYATYRLTILLPSAKKPLTIGLYPMTSHTLWINGEKITSAGEVSKKKSKKKTPAPYKIRSFTPQSKKLEVVLQVSNFKHYFQGGGGSIRLDETSSFWLDRSLSLSIDLFMVGAILIMAIYHLVIWIQRNNEASAILFSIFCFCMGIRIAVLEDSYITTLLLPNLPLEAIHKIEYLTMSISIIVVPVFFYTIFPKEIPKPICYISVICGFIYSFEIVFFSSHTYMRHVLFYQLIVLWAGVSSFFFILKAFFKKEIGSSYLVVGFTILFIGTVNDVLLAMRIIDSVAMLGYSSFIFLTVQSLVISKRFSDAFYQVEKAEKEIRHLNIGLEAKVEERTREIAVILNNVQSGFFLIDKNLRIKKGSTKSCCQILRMNIKENLSLPSVLRLNKRDASHMQLAIEQIFEDCLPEEAGFRNLRKRYKIDSEIISMEGVTVRDDKGCVDSILFNIANISKICKMEEESYYSKNLLHIVKYKDSFRSFLIDAKKRIIDIKRIIDKPSSNTILTNLHTIKGNSASFGLVDIYHIIHEIEGKHTIDLEDVDLIEKKFKAFLKKNSQTLALDFDKIEEDIFSISEANLNKLGKNLNVTKDQHEIAEIFRAWYHEVTSKTAIALLGPIEKTVESFASKLGKKAQLSIIGGDIKLNPRRMETVLNNLIHLIRNSLNHGIEFPQQRNNKPETGKIEIEFIHDMDNYLINISDDGAGINKAKIVEKALEAEVIEPSELDNLSEENTLLLIFHPKLSTADHVTEVSGRGVGLTSLLNSILDLNGAISVESKVSKGTRFSITIPIYSEIKAVAS